jgi:glutamate-ammonia-ligase adenylyltransferase
MNSDSIQYFHDQLKALPTACQQDVQLVLDDISEQLPDFDPDHAGTDRDWLGVLPAVLCSSRFIASLLRRDAGYLVELIDSDSLFSALDTGRLSADLAASLGELEDEQEIMRILRRTRNQAMLQIAFRDLAGWASLTVVMQGLSETADALLSTALDRAYRLLVARHGVPLGSDTRQPQQLVALGMGKLGGGELNFSSDVDLIFCFPENGETDAARPLANGEFFTRLARFYIKLLTTQTADGFVYRVDTRLRPNGDSGPLTLSFSAMDNYYQLHGRGWERYAFIKARVVAGDQANGKLMLDSLRPFVYRKYLDYAAVESIRDMKEMIERELSRKKEMQRNIKLGPGGIREVEFIAQAHQLIRGGRDRTLQSNSLLITLEQLLASGLIDDSEYQLLNSGYEFLRRCENRLQMYADQQTHNLPESTEQQLILARSMGYAEWADFYQALRQHMDAIHAIFHELFMATARPEENSESMRLSHLWQNELADEAACELLEENNYQQAGDLYSRLQTSRNSSLYRNLSTTARERMDRLLPVLLEEVGQSRNPDETIIRCLDLLSAIARRPVYLSLLLDNNAVRQSLVRMTGASPYVSILLNRYPILLDDLLTGYSLEDFQPEVLSESLQKHLASHDREDLEQMLNLLREFQHSKHLGVASLGINHDITAGDTGRSLTNINRNA